MINFIVSSNFNNSIYAINARIHAQKVMSPEALHQLKLSFRAFMDESGAALRKTNKLVVTNIDYLQLDDKISVSFTTPVHIFELTRNTEGIIYALRIIETKSKKLIRDFKDIEREQFDWLVKLNDVAVFRNLEDIEKMPQSTIAMHMFDFLFQLLQTSLLVTSENKVE